MGSGDNQAGVELSLRPTLIITASNNDIKDPDLRTRFTVIEFPKPTEQQLRSCALSLLKDSGFDRSFFNRDGETLKQVYEDDFNRMLRASTQFRAIQQHIPFLLTAWREGQDIKPYFQTDRKKQTKEKNMEISEKTEEKDRQKSKTAKSKKDVKKNKRHISNKMKMVSL